MKKPKYNNKPPVKPAPLAKTLPHDDALEKALLGAVLLSQAVLGSVQTLVDEDTFYNPAHRLIWQAIVGLSAQCATPDVLTVANQLRTTGRLVDVGGASYLATLTNNVGYLHNAEFMARALFEKQMLRHMIANATEIINGAYNHTDPFELLDMTAQNAVQLNKQLGISGATISIKKALAQADSAMQDGRIQGKHNSGVCVGFAAFDDVTGGLQPGELMVLAARPGMGKTALALQMARNAAVQQNVPTAFISLEMPCLQLTNRLQAAEAKIPLANFKKALFTDEEFNAKNAMVAKLAAAPLYVDDTASQNIVQLCARAKNLQLKHNIGLLVVDYLQLITPVDRHYHTNREQDISHISRSLKLLAKEMNIPIVALSQLSRAVELRGSKMPVLSDLRESGAIEQDADLVAFIYRPAYYKNDNNSNMYPHGYTELNIAKHRNGSLADMALDFNMDIQHFTPTPLIKERDYSVQFYK